MNARYPALCAALVCLSALLPAAHSAEKRNAARPGEQMNLEGTCPKGTKEWLT